MKTPDIRKLISLPSPKNAIKEAVLTLFFAHPIKELETLDSHLKASLSDFLKHEKVHEKQFQVSFSEKDSSVSQDSKSNLAGYRFHRLNKEGDTDLFVQLLNDANRQFISIHSLKYKRWVDFKSDISIVIKSLTEIIDTEVVAFSLHYIDELKCKSENIPIEDIFRKESDLLSTGFFKSQNSLLIFNTEKNIRSEKLQDKQVFDRIEIKLGNQLVLISHNSIVQIADSRSLLDFIDDGENVSDIEFAHDANKKLLKDILSENIQEIIGLT